MTPLVTPRRKRQLALRLIDDKPIDLDARVLWDEK
jgi:hypothetical protein